MAVTLIKHRKGNEVMGTLWENHGDEVIRCKDIWNVLPIMSKDQPPM